MDIMRRIDRALVETGDAYIKELEAEVARLRAALVALTSGDPTYWSDMSGTCCVYCYGYDEDARTHAPDCPWLAAKALLPPAES